MGSNARENLLDAEDTLDYNPAHQLMEQILHVIKPDAVVNLGDFTEPFYDEDTDKIIDELLPLYREVECATIVHRLRGNHDRFLDLPDTVTIDGVRYEHGHKLAANYSVAVSRKEYTKMVRVGAAELETPVVHGHTHAPCHPTAHFPFDVGSITYTMTAGLITDGRETRLLHLS